MCLKINQNEKFALIKAKRGALFGPREFRHRTGDSPDVSLHVRQRERPLDEVRPHQQNGRHDRGSHSGR